MMKSAADGPVGHFLRTVFDTIPLPTFIVEADMTIRDYNSAAAQLLGPNPEAAFLRRGGDAFHCIHAEPAGCGNSDPCKHCILRSSVANALAVGKTDRRIHKAELHRRGEILLIDLLVTANRLPDTEPPQVLLILEDVTELITLRRLIPICAQCKRVRDDQQYWHSLEAFLDSHMSIGVTHSLCPSCLEEQLKAVDEQ